MLYAYKVQILLPYWDEPREFENHDFPPDMAKLLGTKLS